MRTLLQSATALLLSLPLLAGAAVQTRTIEYRHDGTELRGHLAWNDEAAGKRPGVIVVHEWWGLNDYARQRAEMLADQGYIAFAVDMYGADKVTEHGQQAKEWMQQITANVEQWRGRALKGLEILRAQEMVDQERLAAVGYCFGGATVMQMAYAGADLDGVASFHGSLPPAPENADIKAKIFAAHGSEDAFVPAQRVQAFQDSLNALDADWHLVVFGNTRHAFTNPEAGKFGIENIEYNEQADRRSWQHLQLFFDEIFE